jgi:hypothetical protein
MQQLLDLIPRLRAEDALLASTVAAVGSGSLKSAKKILADWERTAGSASAPRSWAGNLAALAAMGVEVVEEPRG